MFNNAYKGKTVLVTGHTGFKGSWLSIWLTMMGAKVVGYALEPTSERDNFCACRLHDKLHADVRGDVRDSATLEAIIRKYQPEIIFHLAAQALVRTSYDCPKLTYETNLMGSLNVLEAMRRNDCVRIAIMVTTDKCYRNVEQIWGYRETDPMGGYDPYSSSKGCAELMIASYRDSFFNPSRYAEHGKAVASVRAGNVIAGGDWAVDRIIPDCIRSIEAGRVIQVRNPGATRPWEHVLEPLSGYLRVGQRLMEDPVKYATCFNFGPTMKHNKTVMEVVQCLVDYYGKGSMVDASDPNAVHENTLLSLDVTKAYTMLQWESKWSLQEAMRKTVDWYKSALTTKDMYEFCIQQINEHRDHIAK